MTPPITPPSADDGARTVRTPIQDQWFWWAGYNEEEYRLAGPCRSREAAISEAYGDTCPGDTIFLIEAKAEEFDDGEGLFPFTETRNRSHVIREEDK
jgi:hypothetical protein